MINNSKIEIDKNLTYLNKAVRDPWRSDAHWSVSFQRMFKLGQQWNELPEEERLAHQT